MKLSSVLACVAFCLSVMVYRVLSRINPGKSATVSSELSRDNCVEEEFNYTSSKECHCYLFQSAGRSQGIFKSPSFPRFYPVSVGCILYIFIGALDELVELTLNEFDMRPRNKDGKCNDYVRLFLNLDRPEISVKDLYDVEACGLMSSLRQSVFFSRHRVIIAELHTSGRFGYNYEHRGFKGRFRFIRRAIYKVDGVKNQDSTCHYVFSAKILLNGRFFSPNYPQNYPTNYSCRYEFIGKSSQRVIVDLDTIRLAIETTRCDPMFAGDRLVVYDGGTRSHRVLARYCGEVRVRQVVSHGDRLTILFHSDANGEQAQGFSGRYQFVNQHSVQPTPFLDDTMRGDDHTPGEFVIIHFEDILLGDISLTDCVKQSGDRLEVFDGDSPSSKRLAILCGSVGNERFESSGNSMTIRFSSDSVVKPKEQGFKALFSFHSSEPVPYIEADSKSDTLTFRPHVIMSNGSCRFHIFSQSQSTSGFLHTPGYPNGFRKGQVCSWRFYGKPRERIRIAFKDFALNSRKTKAGEEDKECEGRDRMEIRRFPFEDPYSDPQRRSRLLCGHSDPRPIMSSQRSRLDLVFRADQSSYGSARGIRFMYSFSRDFGVTASGAQQNPDECVFLFSSQRASNGSFTSPNYPGDYPENLICEYIFKSFGNLRISIAFADFYVANRDLHPTCRLSSGDYVEASSCSSSSTKFSLPYLKPLSTRLCGKPNRGQIFRIEWPDPCLLLRFHSNDAGAGRGFYAYYSFHYADDHFYRRQRIGSGIALSVTSFWQWLAVYLFVLLIT